MFCFLIFDNSLPKKIEARIIMTFFHLGETIANELFDLYIIY